jgi:hypothetical protein
MANVALVIDVKGYLLRKEAYILMTLVFHYHFTSFTQTSIYSELFHEYSTSKLQE